MKFIHLQYVCKFCGLEGETPEVDSNEARGLLSDELKIRCPQCSNILTIKKSLLDIVKFDSYRERESELENEDIRDSITEKTFTGFKDIPQQQKKKTVKDYPIGEFIGELLKDKDKYGLSDEEVEKLIDMRMNLRKRAQNF